ncbi:methionyl-tRNA formyltransferase [Rhizobium sp. P32RR-XVIII]|uniref:methionyl-tRNA formyltransferase n=1 Tax=Rhizobium sp. P32RR-XVIII TaxID=2726738 RepID=UPI001456AF2A|nr:methionyl-tRNA formyltransferase [Rhizobium sp. P32RR-XVIII]NLS07794.1 methionyl-tRNA formyltransferase [Rhizobium sp. P32RR-XVIII]
MRIVFVGAVEGSRVALAALLASGCSPALVITLPLTAAQRHSDFADIASMAAAENIPVCYTTDINSAETLARIASADPDIILVIGWSQICRRPFRELARIGSIGFHPAALPQLRGRGVIAWTILRGEQTAGSTLFWLDDGVDSGPILLQRIFDVAHNETARSLYSKQMLNVREMVPQAVKMIEAGSAPGIPQDETKASYCARRRPEDGLIDWRLSASYIVRFIRAVGDPYPGAFTHSGRKRIYIDAAELFPHPDRYIGLPGQIQAVSDCGFLVMCGDGRCIDVNSWRPRKPRPPMHSHLRRVLSA